MPTNREAEGGGGGVVEEEVINGRAEVEGMVGRGKGEEMVGAEWEVIVKRRPEVGERKEGGGEKRRKEGGGCKGRGESKLRRGSRCG